jgi:hypothetical protein
MTLTRTARRKTGQLTANPLFQQDAHRIIARRWKAAGVETPQRQILVFNGTWSTRLPFLLFVPETFCWGAAFLLRCSRSCLFLRGLLSRRLWRLAHLCLITTLVSQTRTLSQHQLYL